MHGNIVSLDDRLFAHEYVEAVKSLDSNYTVSNFKNLFYYSDHTKLIRKYPELKIKCDRGDFNSQFLQFDPISDTFVQKLTMRVYAHFIDDTSAVYLNLTHTFLLQLKERIWNCCIRIDIKNLIIMHACQLDPKAMYESLIAGEIIVIVRYLYDIMIIPPSKPVQHYISIAFS